jgi:hypothetical protein
MAFSSTRVGQGQIAGLKCELYDWNGDSVTEGIVRTGLGQVLMCILNNDTTEDQGLVKRNKSAASTVENGAVFISGFTSGDVGQILVIGN